MVGTVQFTSTGYGALREVATKEKEIGNGTHKLLLNQLSTKPFVFALCSDSNFMKTLSSLHSPTNVQGIILKRRKIEPKHQ